MPQPADLSAGFLYSSDRIENGRIQDGLWANLAAEVNYDFPDLTAGYGYMRAPWSMNPSPYISRFTSLFNGAIPLPSCQMHYAALTEYSSMMAFFYDVSMLPHAPVHTLAGGIFGCDELRPLLEKGYITSETAMEQLCAGWIFQLKEYYRKFMIRPRSGCKADLTDLRLSSCGFDCVEDALFDLQNSFQEVFGPYSDLTLPNATETWTSFICNGGPGGKIFPGDHLESASPSGNLHISELF